MKKLIALLLALVTVLSFASCSKGEPASDNSESGNNQSEESSSDGDSETKEEKLDHIRGSVDGLVYTNTAAEITFTAPEGWVFFSDDEIAALYNLTSEQLLSEETAEILENTNMVYDMYCQNGSTGASVNINFENLGLIYGTVLSEESYLELSKANLESTFSGGGMELVSCEAVTASIDGKAVSCLDLVINMTDYGFELYEKIFVKKAGSFMGCITVGALSSDEIDQIIAGLSL